MPAAANLIACRACDLLQREVALPTGGAATCPRCGAVLYRSNPGGMDRTLALLVASTILFVLANAFPIASIESRGSRNATTLFGAVQTLWNDDMPIIAGLVFCTTILAPALQLFTLIYILLAVRRGRQARSLPALLRLVLVTRPWSMVEVFMLGVLVSVVKLSNLATIVPGLAIWCYGILILLFAGAMATFEPHEVWARLESNR